MTPPIPAPTSRTAYRDQRDRVEVTNVAVAAHLILADHRLLQVVPRRGNAIYIFSLEAQPALDKLKRAAEEALAHSERAAQEQERRQAARS